MDLVDRDGLLIYSNYNRKGILIDKAPYWEEIENRSGEKIGTIKINGRTDDEDSLLVFCREQGYLDFMGNGWTLLLNIPTRIIFASIIELRNNWILVLLLSIILSISIALFLSFILSKPLTELREAVGEVGKGKFDTRVNIKSRDEIGDLGNYFNKMADNLQRTTTSINNLEQEITERKQVEKTLQQSEEKWHSLVENGTRLCTSINDNFPTEAIILPADNLEQYFDKDTFGKPLIVVGEYEYQQFILDKERRRYVIGNPDVFTKYDKGDEEPKFFHEWHGVLKTSEFIPIYVEELLVNYMILRELGNPKERVITNVGSDGSYQYLSGQLLHCPAHIPDKEVQIAILENLIKAQKLFENAEIDEITLMQVKVLNKYNEKRAMLIGSHKLNGPGTFKLKGVRLDF
ncbi:HAMP domain-containing protein [Chloroflexota bacterium]